MRVWEHSKKPLENGKRERNRTTLAFLAMAVSRLDRGTFPAATAESCLKALSGPFCFTYSRVWGLPWEDDGSGRNLYSSFSLSLRSNHWCASSRIRKRIPPGGEGFSPAGEILSGGKKGKKEYGQDINQDGPCRRLFLSFRQSFEEAVLDGFAIDDPGAHTKQGVGACPVRLDS